MRFLPPAPLREECGCRLEGDDSHVGLCVSLGRKYREDVPVSEQASEDHCTWHRFANANMYCVLDGHGGVQCSRVAAAFLEETVRQLSEAGRIAPEALGSVFQSVDDRWAAQCDDSGTTVTLAIVQQRNVTVAHVGDSVAVLVKTDGSTSQPGAAERLTTPHLASNEDEQELVRARGATITAPGGPGESHRVDGLIEVTRALGDVWIKDKISCHPDVYSFEVAPEHKLLILATDGLWDTVNAAQASSVALTELARGSRPVKVAQALAKRAFVSGSVDDIGVLVVLLDAPEAQVPAVPSSGANVIDASCTAPVEAGDGAWAPCATNGDTEGDTDNKAANGRSHTGETADSAGGNSSSCEHRGSSGGHGSPAQRKCADRRGHLVHSPGTKRLHRSTPCAGRAVRRGGPVGWSLAALAATAAVGLGVVLQRHRC